MKETVLYFIIAALVAAVLFLLFRLFMLRKTVREIDEQLKEKLDIDTNKTISISGLDRYTRCLASDINKQLKKLKKEQRYYENKNDELKVAVTNIAHDIRTPLTAISGYLELFEKAELSEQEKRWMKVICARTNDLKEFTDELFSYSVAYSEQENLKLENLCLNNELADVLAGFYGALKSAGIEPDINITETEIYRKLDRKAFGRIVNNLLSNALKYSAGDLSITLDDSGIIVLSNITENMTPVDAMKLFERFYTVRTAKGSTGLGLSIAKMLTEKMKGTIEAELVKNVLTIKLTFPNT